MNLRGKKKDQFWDFPSMGKSTRNWPINLLLFIVFHIFRCALSKGWDIDIWSNKVLADSLNNCNDPNDPNVNMLLRSLATQAMEQAVYFSTGDKAIDQWEHYGLALKHYTHFTSPIRR